MKLQTYLLSGIALLVAVSGDLRAQMFTTLHAFSASSRSTGMTNWDGAQPYETGVILSGNRLYGTTYYGGVNGNGTLYSVGTDGSNFLVLHTFGATPAPAYTNFDGQAPQGALVLVGDTLYGTALNGGTNTGGYGTVYSVGTNGMGFTMLHSFNNIPDGSDPNGELVVSGNTLFGTTEFGGATTNGQGAVFSINTDGTGFTVLHTFTGPDGGNPFCGLALSGDTLYGATEFGGTNGNGTLYSIKTNGGNFTLLHTFSASTGSYNVDGKAPDGSVVVLDDTVYGTALFGGTYGRGTLFSVKTNGADFTVLHTFTDLVNSGRFNPDGAYPERVMAANGVLYGVTSDGGSDGDGVVYSANTDGGNFTVLHTFSASYSIGQSTNYDGAYSEGQLVLSGNILYGTAEQGGAFGNGTVFALTIVPSITSIGLAGTNLVLAGTGGIAGETCTLLASTNLNPALSQWTPIATNVLSGNSFSMIVSNAVLPGAVQCFYAVRVQ